MNVLPIQSAQHEGFAGLYQQRSDEQRRAIVDRGILVQASFNTVCAIEYMKSNNIAPQVIERVLLHPEQRRKNAH